MLSIALVGCDFRPETMAGTITGKLTRPERVLVFGYQGFRVDQNLFNAVEIGDCVRITLLNVRADVFERLDPSDPACTYQLRRIR